MSDEVTIRPAGEVPTAEEPGTPAPPGRGWMLAAVCIATFMLLLDLTVVSVALPDIRSAFGSSFSALQWVLDAYALALAVFLLTAGSLADRVGRKRVFVVGLVVFVLASLGCGLAGGVGFLSVARAVQGVGGAILFAVGPALIGHDYRGKDRAAAFGIFGAVIGLAIAVGPVVGGLLADIDWRYIFLINVPIGVVALVIALARVGESRDPRPRPVDRAGLVLFCAALTLLVLGFLRGGAEGWSSGLVIGAFVAAVVLFIAFVVVERRLGDRAMLDLTLVGNRTFNGLSVTTLLYAATAMSALFLEVSYIQNVLGYSPLQAGLRFLPLTITIFVIAGASGGLLDKVPPRALVGISMVGIAVGLGLVRLAQPGSSWLALLPSMLVMGFGMGLFNPARAALSIAVVEPARAGMASGISETLYQVGTAVGIAAFGAYFQARVSAVFDTPQTVQILGAARGSEVAAGAGAQLAGSGTSPGAAAQVLDAARAAFVDGLGDMTTAAAVVALLGAVCAFLLLRREDLHASAR